MITIVKDKEPIYDTDKYDTILVGTSIFCMLSNGFQRKMRIKFDPELDKLICDGRYGDSNKLGKYSKYSLKDSDIASGKLLKDIYLLYICRFPNKTKVSVDYDALENVLKMINYEQKGKKVMTTLLGGSIFDGNGNRDKIMEIINRVCKDIDLFIYDYRQKSYKDEINEYENKLKHELYKKNLEGLSFRKEYYKRHEFLKENYLEL